MAEVLKGVAMVLVRLTWGNLGKLFTLPQLLGVGHWPIILALILGGLLLCRWLERRGYDRK